ncbi:MAG: SGNH/GDSL hydrolase family protein [Oscillospiraceae bacterium]|nr:SGNH/GDSL hydrolase family protein [Oscillospiraceae bacterium]
MDIHQYISVDPSEKPLDHIVTDGGFCGIFRTIGCIGDSLSSGEFEAITPDGNRSYHDKFEYSWGQYIARDAGCTVYNFSRGGMTAIEYWQSFARDRGFWDKNVLCQAYIVALGVNDLLNQNRDLGTIEDARNEDPEYFADNFAWYLGTIIKKYRALQPEARFFLMTMPRDTRDGPENDAKKQAHRELLYQMAELFPYTYVIDLYQYAPVYDEDFRDKFFLHGHLNPAGYRLTAKMVESYIDYYIRHDFGAFRQTGFIGSPSYDYNLD